MWIFTKNGFYSAIQDKDDSSKIWVRARVENDLLSLIAKYNVKSTTIMKFCGTDYLFRICMQRSEWMRIVAESALDIDYVNFKDMIGVTFGIARELVYHEVWCSLYKLQLVDEYQFNCNWIRNM